MTVILRTYQSHLLYDIQRDAESCRIIIESRSASLDSKCQGLPLLIKITKDPRLYPQIFQSSTYRHEVNSLTHAFRTNGLGQKSDQHRRPTLTARCYL